LAYAIELYFGLSVFLRGPLVQNRIIPRRFLFHILSGGLILALFYGNRLRDLAYHQKRPGYFWRMLRFIDRRHKDLGRVSRGVCYSILIMNSAVPLIDRLLSQKIWHCQGEWRE